MNNIRMKLKKILLTGTTGFIGSYILEHLLKKNYQITDVIRKNNKNLLRLKKKYRNNYTSIKSYEIYKLKRQKFNFFIHLATFYKSDYKINEINKLLKSNIFFPMQILNHVQNKKLKIINFGSMMEYKGETRDPKNIYAASKILFEEILKKFNFEKCYNIKIFDTYDLGDNRPKIIPTMLKCLKKNIIFKLNNKKLKLNFISRNDVAIMVCRIIEKNLTAGTYILKNKTNENIYNLFTKLNNLKNKKFKNKVSRYKKIKKEKLKIVNFEYKVFNHIKDEI